MGRYSLFGVCWVYFLRFMVVLGYVAIISLFWIIAEGWGTGLVHGLVSFEFS